MHSAIRIVTFLVFGVFVALGNVGNLVLAFILISSIYLIGHPHLFEVNWRMVKRMRWLFLSIFIIYLWFTPGLELIPELGSWSPSVPGTQQGIMRILSLVLIVFGVNLLVKTDSQENLTSALIWLLTPLRWLRLPHEKLAIRMSLTFSLISEVQYLHELKKKNQNSRVKQTQLMEADNNTKPNLMQRLDAIGTYAADLMQAVLDKSLEMSSQDIKLAERLKPPSYQWAYPVILIFAFMISDSVIG